MQNFIGNFLAVVNRKKILVGGEISGETWEGTVQKWNGAVFRLYQTKFGAESCFEYENNIRNMQV